MEEASQHMNFCYPPPRTAATNTSRLGTTDGAKRRPKTRARGDPEAIKKVRNIAPSGTFTSWPIC